MRTLLADARRGHPGLYWLAAAMAALALVTAGLAVITEPVHTMTGIIAQEMGEVVRGSIHYRALFVVGLALFLLSLGINYAAQGIVRRYRLPAG